VQEHAGEVACFIYEPLLQAAGGMHSYDAALMDQLLDTVQSRDILCIADEVLTGFGRTGTLFAGERLRNKADIICLSKGLTGGTMALGATAATEKIFEAFLSDDKRKTLFHGHSFTANPLACSAALASLDLITAPGCLEQTQDISRSHGQFAERIKDIPLVRNIRIVGTIIAFEVNAGEDGYTNTIGADITRNSLEKGIYLRPLGNTVYIMPPYCITAEELRRVYDFLERFLNER
jgi:adenosylmethionine-8-amino-7-oxononanoate aminotransferase